MPTQYIVRRSGATPATAKAGVAPIYVDSDDNKLKYIPAGSGTSEVEVLDASATQTLTNKTLTSPSITAPSITGAGTISLTGASAILETQTITAASISAAQYNIRSGITINPTTTFAAAGNLLSAVRGDITLGAGKDITTGYFYGVSGKFIATTGTITGSGACIAGVNGKVDLGTLALSIDVQSSGVWADLAGTPTGDGLAQINAIRITNSMGGSTRANAMIYISGLSTYFLEYANVDTTNVYLAAGTSANSPGKSDGCAAQKVLKVNIGGATCYIPVFTQNT